MEIGFIPKETGAAWIKEVKEISSMVYGLIRTRKSYTDC